MDMWNGTDGVSLEDNTLLGGGASEMSRIAQSLFSPSEEKHIT